MADPLALAVLVATAGLGAWAVLRRRKRPAKSRPDWEKRLSVFGLQPVAERANADFATTEWAGVHEGRGLRLRLLERPGSRFVLFWLKVRMPARIPEGTAFRWDCAGVGLVTVREVEGGYRLACRGRNLHDLMGDVELGLPAFDHSGVFGVQAKAREGYLELGCAASPPSRTVEDVRDLYGLVAALEHITDAPWKAAAERFGLELRPHDRRGHRHIGGIARQLELPVEVFVREGRTVVEVVHDRDLGVVIRHIDLGRGVSTGHAVADMLLGCSGSEEVLAELLSDEERVGALLAVVHAHKGSELSSNRVSLRADRMLGEDLGDHIATALDLARRL